MDPNSGSKKWPQNLEPLWVWFSEQKWDHVLGTKNGPKIWAHFPDPYSSQIGGTKKWTQFLGTKNGPKIWSVFGKNLEPRQRNGAEFAMEIKLGKQCPAG